MIRLRIPKLAVTRGPPLGEFTYTHGLGRIFRYNTFSFRTPDEENIGLRVEPFRMPFCESRRKGSLERFAFLCR